MRGPCVAGFRLRVSEWCLVVLTSPAGFGYGWNRQKLSLTLLGDRQKCRIARPAYFGETEADDLTGVIHGGCFHQKDEE